MVKEKPITKEDILASPGRYAGGLFSAGELEKAWKAYSWREKEIWSAKGRVGLGITPWFGQDLRGKRLVLGYEQALGEQIMFCSMLPDLLKMGAELTVEVDPRLVTLIQRSFPTCRVIPWGHPWHPAVYDGDYYTLLGNPAGRLRSKLEDFPGNVKYLQADTSLVKRLHGFNVGISWWSPTAVQGDTKNVPLQDFNVIYEDYNTNCINLQYGLQEPPKCLYTYKDVDLNNDLDSVAAIVAQCDVIITISNTITHMAGALGKETYLLITKGKARHFYHDLPFYSSVTKVELENTWKETIDKLYKIILDKRQKNSITMGL